MSKFNPLEFEPEVQKFWEENKIHQKANEKNSGKPKFYFCDGPPYTSGKVHIGTAWNKSLKDSIIRYKRMQGFFVLDRAGYDMHGLPTENATEKKLGIKDKDEIPKMGVDKFVKACKELAIENMKVMNKDFQRLGVWMDFDNAYQSVTREFISGVWWVVKQAHEKGRLYEGMRSMSWDWAHQTAVAKHEIEYNTVTDESIYVKMQLKGKDNEFFVIWTTTPWTIPFNLGIMAGEDVDYVKCQVDDEVWIVAKERADALIKELLKKDYKVVEEIKGKDLKGVEYSHPFQKELAEHYDKIKADHPNTHTVVMSGFVETTAGSGLVHMAPGCGPEDYEVGHANNIPAWNLVQEDGVYNDQMGKFSGRHAYNDNSTFIDDLEANGHLVATQKIRHEYPHGERSHKPVIFRTTKQWFFKVEDIKDQLIAENDKINWVPKAGYNAFNGWLNNLRDNSVSKQRYWGTPVPVWRNVEDESDYIVIGSVDELEALAGKEIDEPHIPWIDDMDIEKDGKIYKRVPDILDVWVDAGSASWNSLNFPADKDALKNFPIDFLLEGKDQVRGWFNLLHIASMLGHGTPAFKAAYMHGFVQDAQGRKMSKSLGNYITPDEVIDKYGADTLRYYMIGGTGAGTDINYNFEDLKAKQRNLSVLWNVHNYILDLAKTYSINPTQSKVVPEQYGLEERYILSKAQSSIRRMTKLYDEYRLDEPPHVVESLYLELSRTYLQQSRDKVATSPEEREVVLHTAYSVLMDVLKLLSPIAPFISEKMYQNIKGAFGLETESVHLLDWPSVDESLINKDLEIQIDVSGQVVQAALAAREKMKRGLRWPIQNLTIVSTDEKVVKAVEAMKDVIKNQVNVKQLDVQQSLPDIKLSAKPDFKQIKADFEDKGPKIIAKLAVESAEMILAHIEKDKKYVMDIDGEKVSLVSEHLVVNREVPKQYQEGIFGNNQLYLDTRVNDELEAEGFAREVMRRVQVIRKNAGMEKTDRISLFVKADDELVDFLSGWEKQIKEKVGADQLNIASNDPAKEHQHTADEKIKGKEIKLFLDKA